MLLEHHRYTQSNPRLDIASVNVTVLKSKRRQIAGAKIDTNQIGGHRSPNCYLVIFFPCMTSYAEPIVHIREKNESTYKVHETRYP